MKKKRKQPLNRNYLSKLEKLFNRVCDLSPELQKEYLDSRFDETEHLKKDVLSLLKFDKFDLLAKRRFFTGPKSIALPG